MEVIFDRGVYLPELDFWMDSRRKQDTSLISHGHSDHTARHRRPILTLNTRLLLSDYLIRSDPVTLEYREPLERSKYTLTLHPAGHCLGSAQALLQSKVSGERVLYTGDFKARINPINEPMEPVPCDVLIMESTYGRPEYSFPPEEQVLATACQTLRQWLSQGEKPVVRGWRLGKAQELLYQFLDQGFEVLLEDSVYQIACAYRESGVDFPGQLRRFDGDWPEGWILICPPGHSSSKGLSGIRGKRFMELTGWATAGGPQWYRRADASLPYSDHADFNELVEYVRKVQPKQVYTVNGFPDLAAHLRQLGYPAVHLNGKGQAEDAGFQMKML